MEPAHLQGGIYAHPWNLLTKKKRKFIKNGGGGIKMVVERDISLSQILDLFEISLVGKFTRRGLRDLLHSWVS